MIGLFAIFGLWCLAWGLALTRVIMRERTAAYQDKAVAKFLDSIPCINRKRRLAILRAVRSGNRRERERQGFKSWRGLMHRSRKWMTRFAPIKLSTPDGP